MKIVDRIALILVIIGALNWGSIGLFRFDCVAAIFGGQLSVWSRIIRINVISIVFIIQTDRCNNRKEIFFQKIIDDIRIHFFDIADKSDIFTVCQFLIHFQKAAVFSTDTNGSYTELFH